MTKKILIVLALLCGFSITSKSQIVYTIGPMIHLNFGGEHLKVSYAVECSYWNLKNIYYGIDGGIEFEKNAIRLYSELQTGFGLAGISAGPVLELNTIKSKFYLGFQSTIWANFFVGIDYRKRWINSMNYNCAGLYFKFPYKSTGFSSSSTTNNQHYDDWDWDW